MNHKYATQLDTAKKLKADRMIKFDPRTDKPDEDDCTFVNTFISTLPCTKSHNMFEQVLEIEYTDYKVDKEHLRRLTKETVESLKTLSSESSSFEVPTTRGQAI